jgi:hypothetical protein
VWYRARIRESRGSEGATTILNEERGIGFRVADGTGSVRVFPRGATFDVPTRFKDHTGFAGELPAGLQLRTGSPIGLAEPSHEEQIAALLTVHRDGVDDVPGSDELLGGAGGGGRREYEEARLEPGEVVTVVGRVLTFEQLTDPLAADASGSSDDPASAQGDPEVAADLAEARAAGLLTDDAEEAWGNAAIAGFGIGRPVRRPHLDPAARTADLATPEEAAQIGRRFDLGPQTLVLAAAVDAPLLVSVGAPAVAADRQEQRFVVGLLGAALSIVSAVALATVIQGFGS